MKRIGNSSAESAKSPAFNGSAAFSFSATVKQPGGRRLNQSIG
jgi:hypothetical protein